jgi:hypothetical protein
MIVGAAIGDSREDVFQGLGSPFNNAYHRNNTRSSRTLQQAEKEWLQRFNSERLRHHSKEVEQKKQIGKLNTTVQ